MMKAACCAMWRFTQVLLGFGLLPHASFYQKARMKALAMIVQFVDAVRYDRPIRLYGRPTNQMLTF